MPLNPPSFWHKKGPISTILTPFGWAYNKIVQHRLRGRKTRASVPVVCIGNLTLGGSGKTPTTAALADYLKKTGHTPHILSRGHGGTHTHTHRVTPEDTAKDVGDEPILLSKMAPVWVGKNRGQSAKNAVDAGATVLLMDDGFQHPHIHKNLSLVVVDGQRGFGNGLVFPAGPLREDMQDGLRRADAILVITPPSHALEKILSNGGVPIFYAHTTFSAPKKAQDCVAFAGIAYPEKFFEALSLSGITIKKKIAFPDHHLFTKKELATLRATAEKEGAPLCTTEKDFVRLGTKDQRSILILKMAVSLPKNFLEFFNKKVQKCV